MINFILVYKIRKKIKKILKERERKGEIDFSKSCLDCVVNEIAWEIYYLLRGKGKESEKDDFID
ncbi:MAG: hypothetical protein ACUVUG_09730 [Candidatus Aminicenantia bacterium]